jgi:hypothetical protein
MFVARRRRISASFGSVQRTSSPDSHLTGTGTRHGLSLARNSAFATITRSSFPTCTFATTQDKFRESVRSPAPSLGFGFEADAGRSLRRTPVFRVNFPRSHGLDGLHSPSGHCSPPDQSVQPFQPPEAHLAERPIALSAPRRTFFQSRVGSKLPDSLRPAQQIVP